MTDSLPNRNINEFSGISDVSFRESRVISCAIFNPYKWILRETIPWDVRIHSPKLTARKKPLKEPFAIQKREKSILQTSGSH